MSNMTPRTLRESSREFFVVHDVPSFAVRCSSTRSPADVHGEVLPIRELVGRGDELGTRRYRVTCSRHRCRGPTRRWSGGEHRIDEILGDHDAQYNSSSSSGRPSRVEYSSCSCASDFSAVGSASSFARARREILSSTSGAIGPSEYRSDRERSARLRRESCCNAPQRSRRRARSSMPGSRRTG